MLSFICPLYAISLETTISGCRELESASHDFLPYYIAQREHNTLPVSFQAFLEATLALLIH